MQYRLVFIATLTFLMAMLAPAVWPIGLSATALAQTVSRVIVEGNQRVETETILSYTQISPGDPITEEAMDESVKALFQTGLFADVDVAARGSTVVVRVEENPLINRVNFEGNSEIKDDNLLKEVELRERMIFTRARVQSDVQRIVALYRRSGHFSARVEPKIIRLPQNRVDLVFEINEGGATQIERISFIGNEAFSDGQLRRAISTAESRWWKFFATTDNYDPDRLEFDKELLRRYYLKNGYADFRVVSATAELAPDGESFFISFMVEEGPEYKVGAVSVNTGNTTLDPNTLNGLIKTNSGSRYNANMVDRTVEELTLEAGKSGFAFAKVEPNIERNPESQILDIVYDIQEGPRVYIERIDIRGNVRTLDEVLRREIRLVEGDAYNRILVDRARRRLTALDFFEKVDIREEPGSRADQVVLVIEVQEKSTGSIAFSAGYSSTETIIGSISVQERNFLGRGQNVGLSTNLSLKRQAVNFSFTEPYFLGRRVSAGIDGVFQRTDLEKESSYSTQQYGGGFRLGFRLDENSTVGTKYSFLHRIVEVSDDADVSWAILDSEGTTNKSMFGLNYTYDQLDNPLKPTSGYRLQSMNEFAGIGGDVRYASAEVAGYYFYPLMEGFVVKVKGTGGHMEGWGGEEVPILDRFFKGGESFRGFARSGIGPRMERQVSGTPTGSTDAIGGQTYAIGTVEVSFPVGLPEEFGVSGSVFSDFGTLFNAPEEDRLPGGGKFCDGSSTPTCDVFDTAEFRASVGAGLTWDSPFGPLRFDVAYPFLKADYDKVEYFRFGIATKF
jgi:outer membrane protein insertion porin family